jgi:hypothetical protein
MLEKYHLKQDRTMKFFPDLLGVTIYVLAGMLLFANMHAQDTRLANFSKLKDREKALFFTQVQDRYRILPDGQWLTFLKVEGKKYDLFGSNDMINWITEINHGAIKDAGYQYISKQVSQNAGNGKYHVDSHRTLVTAPGNAMLVEGDWIEGLAVNAGFYEYETVLGERRKVPHYMIVSLPPPTEEEIIQVLSKGGSLPVIIKKEVHCPACGGMGRVRKHDGDLLRSADCGECEGQKKIQIGELYEVTY